MTDIDNLIAAYAERTEKRPICEQTAYEAIRHINRNCDMLCESHEDGSECVEWARYDGTLLAQIWNAFPALSSELEAARKVVAEMREMVDQCDLTITWRNERGMKPATDISIFAPTALSGVIKIKRYFEQALAEYLRVLEEQR